MITRKANKTAIGRCKGIDGLILSATWKEAEYGTTSIWGVKPSFSRYGERKLSVTRPRQGEKIIMNYCRAYFLTVVE